MARIFADLARLRLRSEQPVQVAAICYRVNGSSVEFLLVNTSSGKWTFPKGRLNPSLTPSESAAQEAWEEAGATGRITEKHFDSYVDIKRALGHDDRSREVRIAAYLLEVESTVTPRESGRNPSWFSAREARKQLAEGRSSLYAKQIVSIVDSALDRLLEQNRKSASILVRAQSRRLAPAR
ncbi:MAG TPA: NUDIX domain-containing protein [Candidatus Angelobacter sp.]|nr:NUDIX domain-containing protein [Candidatus Angelobacter sp.]